MLRTANIQQLVVSWIWRSGSKTWQCSARNHGRIIPALHLARTSLSRTLKLSKKEKTRQTEKVSKELKLHSIATDGAPFCRAVNRPKRISPFGANETFSDPVSGPAVLRTTSSWIESHDGQAPSTSRCLPPLSAHHPCDRGCRVHGGPFLPGHCPP